MMSPATMTTLQESSKKFITKKSRPREVQFLIHSGKKFEGLGLEMDPRPGPTGPQWARDPGGAGGGHQFGLKRIVKTQKHTILII